MTQSPKNLLLVEESINDDNSVVHISEAKLGEMKMFRGDTVLLKGRKNRRAVCVALSNEPVSDSKIRMNRCLRKNLAVKPGDSVTVHPCLDIKRGKSINVRPIDDTVKGITGSLFDLYLKPYFLEAYRPVHQGDLFLVHDVEFEVERTDPTPYCIVAPDTSICCYSPVRREAAEEMLNAIGYEDVGGCKTQLDKIRHVVTLLLRHPQLFQAIGAKPPKGLLLHGDPGNGKKLCARAVANELGASFVFVNGVLDNLREAFEEAKIKAPSILFIEHLEEIANSEPSTAKERYIGSQLLTLAHDLELDSRVVIVASTKGFPGDIDPLLRRSELFGCEVEFCEPCVDARKEILQIHTRNMKLADDVSLQKIADFTSGFSASDLAGLCSKAALGQIVRNVNLAHMEADQIDDEQVDSLAVTMKDFTYCIECLTNMYFVK